MAAAVTVAVMACRVLSLEEQLLTRFFEAGRFFDQVALARVATVGWNPATAGIVKDFEVSRVDAVSASERQVFVLAQVRSSDGRVTARSFDVTIELLDGRWMITRLLASQTSPAASSAPPS